LDDEKENDSLVQVSALGPKNPSRFIISQPLRLKFGEGIVGAAAASKKTVLVNDTEKDERYIVDDTARKSELAVPVVFGDQTYAVIDSESSTSNFFNEEHQKLLECFANIIAPRIYLCHALAKNNYDFDPILTNVLSELTKNSETLSKLEKQKLANEKDNFINLDQPLNSALSVLQTLKLQDSAEQAKYFEILKASLLEMKSTLDPKQS